jgi:copper homeostasis protein
MREIILEVCVEGVAACHAARDGGAARLEVCSALDVGGLTPSVDLVNEAIAQSGLPVHVMIRPRAGGFVYSETEFTTMLHEVDEAKPLGVAGVVFGVLRSDRTVDVERTRKLVDRARPMQVTFHRAFDDVVNLDEALEDVIATGCDRLLTSGGEPDVVAGASALARLVARSAGRIAIAAGGGLRLRDAAHLARVTGATHFHGSMTEGPQGRVDAATVRRMLELLRGV